jgi:membrane protein YdbS with pleckstrin-like domain
MICLDKLPNSLPEEKVSVFLRRHWIDLLKIFLLSGLMLLVPVAVIAILELGNIDLLSSAFWGPLSILMLASYILIVYSITLTEITDYWLDVWIVTTERVINAEQHGLFNRLVSEVHLEQIQDITSETRGFLETFLTYGDVYVQTAGERERFRFKNVDNPDDVKITISELVTTCKNTHHHDPKVIAPGIGAPSTSQHHDAKMSV